MLTAPSYVKGSHLASPSPPPQSQGEMTADAQGGMTVVMQGGVTAGALGGRGQDTLRFLF